ncbi:MAG: hypothetical protein JST40_11220 [Armatimonadetes bacterium]|nr:hypothetical protein [Armatimonadota bacterium]
MKPTRGGTLLYLSSGGNVSRLQFRWKGDLSVATRFLGDHWERSYGDLGWRSLEPNRVMPWYFLAEDEAGTHAYGVKTGCKSLCFWACDDEGISLWSDVRNGGNPVQLGSRQLLVAEVLCRRGEEGESSFATQRAFCKMMCPKPRLADHTPYGTNDWDYAYGDSSAELILGVSKLISELSPNQSNRPYSVIDEGWAMGPYKGKFGYGPWVGNPKFGDMGEVAAKLKAEKIRPGIWFRPLTPLDGTGDEYRLARSKSYLDPTHPFTQEHVATHFKRFVDWGFEMIKHDFTTFDICGKWGFQMGPNMTNDGWNFHDKTKTTAEVILDLYQHIRDASGNALLIGCNTIGHLAAGSHELQRTGDDTSGRSWDRTRRMGVNTLAFRAAQHNTFFAADPDIVAVTQSLPWNLVEGFLKLVAESGTALFTSIEPSVIEPKHRTALSYALDVASKPQPLGEPLDWKRSNSPKEWKLRDKVVTFDWFDEGGAWPYAD